MINRGDPWHLGHVVDRALGGTDAQLRPEHAHCSMHARKHVRGAGGLPPSRDW